MPTKMSLADLKLRESPGKNTQRVAVLKEPHRIATMYADIPEPTADEILIRVKWVGVCGSDLEAFRGTRDAEFISIPTRLGHEVAGYIEKVGSRVIGLQVGDPVVCRYVWGAFSQFITCKPFNVKVVPPEIPLEAASLIEILPGILHTAELGEIDSGRNVLVMGQGVSGLILTQVLSLYSPAALAVTDLNQRNLDIAKRYGATHTYQIPNAAAATMDTVAKDFPDGFDVVIPCLLEGRGMVDAVDAAAVGGRIVMYGCIGVCDEPFDFFKVHRKRLNIFSTEPRRDIDMRRFFQESMQLVKDGMIGTLEIIDKHVPLSSIDQAFELRNDLNSGFIHVLVDCEA